MRKLILIHLFLAFCLSGVAQILNSKKELFGDEPFFNPAHIKTNKIKSITGELHFKRDYEKMDGKGLFIQYNFDQKGRLTSQLSTFKKTEGAIDTAVILYEYDSLSRLCVKRKADALGFYSLNYEYDLNNNLTKETYCRDVNQTPFYSSFVLDKQYPVAVELFSFQYLTPSQYKTKCLNNLSIAYKEIITYLDDKGRVIEKSGRFINTGKTEKKLFKYDQNGNVTEKSEFSDVGGEKKTVYKFKYDEFGKMLEIEKLKNEKPSEHTEFLYDENAFMTARLCRDIEAKLMDVVKYRYEFYK